MITDGKKQYYLAVKSLSKLLTGITSNHVGDIYYSNCFHSYSTKNKLKKHENVCNDHDYCYVEMPNEYNKTLKYNHGEKSIKAPAIIMPTQSVCLKKCIHVKLHPEKFYTEKKLNIRLLVIQYLQVVRLIQQKTNLIVTKVKIVLKGFAKI